MIQVEAILVEDFRGIRRLDLWLGCKSFVVWGPNGSGKSGVVDAIDFALTGTIARLSGTGNAGVLLPCAALNYKTDIDRAAKNRAR